jgi:hypothetical protein
MGMDMWFSVTPSMFRVPSVFLKLFSVFLEHGQEHGEFTELHGKNSRKSTDRDT